jgi:hypothetical protein
MGFFTEKGYKSNKLRQSVGLLFYFFCHKKYGQNLLLIIVQ